MKKNTVAIIQTRTTSTRLPNKVLLPICGKPLLWHVIERVKRCKLINEIVVASPFDNREDTASIKKVVEKCNVSFYLYRGNMNDLVGRHLAAAGKHDADVIVRIPSDNPCIEPSEVDKIIWTQKHSTKCQDKFMFSNTHNILDNGYPDGLGAEVYSMKFFQWIKENTQTPEEMEHPHKICYDREVVKTVQCNEDIRRPELRLDVNTQQDFNFITELYEALYPKNNEFGIRDIIKYLDRLNNDPILKNKALSKPFYRESVLNDLFKKVLK